MGEEGKRAFLALLSHKDDDVFRIYGDGERQRNDDRQYSLHVVILCEEGIFH